MSSLHISCRLFGGRGEEAEEEEEKERQEQEKKEEEKEEGEESEEEANEFRRAALRFLVVARNPERHLCRRHGRDWHAFNTES